MNTQPLTCARNFAFLTALLAAAAAHAASVHDLRCEYRKTPLGLDVAKPRFGWILDEGRQSAYQIMVGDVWDSGKVVSAQSANVEYAGKPLSPGTAYSWKVRIWDADGKETEWAKPASFSTGLHDWQAKWIGYDITIPDSPFQTNGLRWVHVAAGKTELRKSFEVPTGRKVRRAVIALYADNECKTSLNGMAVGNALKWEETARLDITSALRPGTNVITLDPRQTDNLPAAVIGRLIVQFESGEDWQLPVDGTWENAQPFDGTPWGTPSLNDQPRTPAPYLRKEFSTTKTVRRATVYVTALGVYELHLNGQRVGHDELAPGWSEFHKRVYYQTYDVTGQVHAGNNVLGAILGDGWYASDLAFTGKRHYYGGNPRFLAQLVMEFADGSSQVIATDNTWKASYGPIRHADLMVGCEYDARLEMPGWDAPGFDDRKWALASEGGAQEDGVVDVTARVAAAEKDGRISLKVENDAFGGDPASNMEKSLNVEYLAGGKSESRTVEEHAMLELTGPGLKITHARYGRRTTRGAPCPLVQAAVADPSRRQEELVSRKLTEPKPGVYIFDLGQNMVGWAKFKLHGVAGQRVTVRYGEMLNPDGSLYTTNLRGATAADFFILSGQREETLEPYFTFHGFRYVELRGVSGKPDLRSVTGVVVHSEMDRTGSFECSSPLVNQLYHNIIWGQKSNYLEVPTDCPQRDERAGWTGDTQFFIPTAAYNYNIAPFFTRWLTTICEDAQHADGSIAHVVPDLGLGSGATAWGDAALICTYHIYRTYGDTRVISDHFPALERLMDWYASKSTNHIPKIGGFGDWLNLGGGATPEVIDTAYYTYLTGLMADMAHAIGNEEAAARYAKLHADIKTVFGGFFDPDGTLRGCGQTGYALAFAMDLVPAALRDKASARFSHEIERFGWHLATGFIGTPRLLPGLHAAGRDDAAYRLLLQESYPSWLFQVKLGATTMWERWDGWTPEKGFQDRGMNSFNHYAFGSVGEYLYGAVAGINAESPGYKKIRIQPVIGDGLTWAKASYYSIYGRINSAWKREGGRVVLNVTIPANTTATVVVPGKNGGSHEVGPGTYEFHAIYP